MPLRRDGLAAIWLICAIIPIYCLDIVRRVPKTVEEDPFGDFGVGRFLWVLQDVVPLREPVPATGRQGIWDW